MDMLRISSLQKRFGDKEVLREVDLTVPAGSIFGFIGKNGAGKTTTMKTVLGLLRADAGQIEVAGERVIYGQTATNRHIGYLPDVPEFYGFMDAQEYLTLCGEITGMPRDQIAPRARELMALVGLDGERHRIRGYSRGMKQRLGIAQALLHRPQLLICDEPTSALDPEGRTEILDILLAVRGQTTVLFSTHILSDVERICTNVALLDGGTVRMQGTLAELRGGRNVQEYVIETANTEDLLLLERAFGGMRRQGENQLCFDEGAHPLHFVLGFLSEHHIGVIRLERIEPTLESLFLEVTGA